MKDELLRLGLTLGESMMQAGAEVYRVEDTLSRLLRKAGAEDVQAIATPTGIYLSVTVQSEVHTAVKRIGRGSIDLSQVCDLNALSRSVGEGASPADVLREVRDIIVRPPEYAKWQQSLMVAVAGGAFAVLFGGGIFEALAGATGALMVQTICAALSALGTNRFLVDFVGGGTAALSALLLNLAIGSKTDLAIIGAIMTLVPGLLLTNAIRDALSGNLLSGTSRLMEAFFVSISLAGGVGAMLSLWRTVGGLL